MDIKLKNARISDELQDTFIQVDLEFWLHYELFSWNWWILVSFLIIPWVIWLKVLDRTRLLDILLVGTLVIIPTTYLDAIGNDFRFWMYPTELLPVTPRAIAYDMSLVAVTYMVIYQYFTTWKSYFIALFVMSFVFAFIGEPISHALHLVYYIKWKYIYSFCYYMVLGLSVKGVVERAKKMYGN